MAENDLAGGEQRLSAVENHAERAVSEARRHHSGRARAIQVVGVFDFDDDAVIEAIGVGGEDIETCLNQLTPRGEKQT